MSNEDMLFVECTEDDIILLTDAKLDVRDDALKRRSLILVNT